MSLDLVSTGNVVGEFIYPQSFRDSFSDSACWQIPLPGRKYNGKDVSIEIVRSDARRDAACELINRMYSWRGYGDSHRLDQRPTHTTFTVAADDEVIGTVTLAADSERGLAVDALFRAEIDHYRNQPRAKVCELTKLAFDTTAESKHLLAALFHVVLIYGVWKHEGTDLFIEVNPRHRRFYEMMLGFERVGDLRTNESVNAPSQLMRLRVADIHAKIDESRSANASCRSLYPFFLSTLEEADVCLNLWSNAAGASLDQATFQDFIEIFPGSGDPPPAYARNESSHQMRLVAI
ncbi:acetyltransferase [Sphingomonas sp. BIUV-7]|uniref:Acetyltransferase n=1 Tax=Sphingomonas natans TaxID=3063330 RepID=A0ABT8YD25_9SPHN|nr:acetyltransferase [Sphingomonas sp. BIUV-7]MDO6416270.1 acetyltransferase [Sphingomonas sp. BIUV-7]